VCVVIAEGTSKELTANWEMALCRFRACRPCSGRAGGMSRLSATGGDKDPQALTSVLNSKVDLGCQNEPQTINLVLRFYCSA